MGCISSKLVTRSGSFREELNQRLQRKTNGFPVLEELLISKNGGDQFLTFVSTANTVTKKLQTRSITLDSETDIKPSLEALNPESINLWELMAGLEEDEKEFIDVGKRSKSFHWPVECALPTEASFGRCEGDFRGILRSRSFHTVQEYDAMVERNWLSEAEDTKFEDLVENKTVKFRDACGTSSDVKQSNIETDVKEDVVMEKNVIEEETGGTKIYKPGDQENETTSVCMSSTSLSAVKTNDVVDDVAKGKTMNEKGLRRKLMAEELTTLRIPSTIDFPAMGNLKEWLEMGGQIFSPGAYVTPKFGTSSLPVPVNQSKFSGGSVFDPEMVTAFEEAMQQLKAEECILKEIVESLEEGSIKEKKAAEDDSTRIKDLALIDDCC